MTRFLLDTSIVSAAMWQTPNARVVAHMRENDCAIGAPVWHELRFGCARLPKGKRRDAVAAYLDEVVGPTMPIVPYDDRAAAWHAAERARLEGLGKPSPFVDGQIAAIAAVNGLTLVTANTADFRGFKGLTIANWMK